MWLFNRLIPPESDSDHLADYKFKCPEVAQLPSYTAPPHLNFWRSFPFRDLPDKPVPKLNIDKLTTEIDMAREFMTIDQSVRATTVLTELSEGVDALQAVPLPAMISKNSGSMFKHGKVVTDTVASWIKKGILSGPFTIQPLNGFRANQMLAIEQKDKVRIIMNLSHPERGSFNDNVLDMRSEKVYMTTAKHFGFSILECGANSVLWKFDLSDAYKILPCKQEDLRL